MTNSGSDLAELKSGLEAAKKHIESLDERLQSAQIGEAEMNALKAQNGNLRARADAQQREQPTWWVILLAMAAVAIIAYGIGQPLILNKIGNRNGTSIAGAEDISILVTVVALLGTVFGYSIYKIVGNNLDQNLAQKLEVQTMKWREKLNFELGRSRLAETFIAWMFLDHLLGEGSGDADPALRALCKDTIDTAIESAQSAVEFADQAMAADINDENRIADLRLGTRLNLAYFLACQYWFDAEKNVTPAGQALAELPTSFEELNRWDRKETHIWVRLCCWPKSHNEHKAAEKAARELYSTLKMHLPDDAAALERRYRLMLKMDLEAPSNADESTTPTTDGTHQ